jgi:tetratricopeptide (TPR) repeat protein
LTPPGGAPNILRELILRGGLEMRCGVWALALLLVVPAVSDAKDKKPKKVEETVPPGIEAVNKAEQNVADGNIEAAIDVLRHATQEEGMSGEPFLRLGQLLEGRFEMDSAIDAYRSAAERLEGAPKGEALARLSLLEVARGMGDPDATAQAAIAADPEGAWPQIALARACARQLKPDEAIAAAQKALAAGGGAPASTALGVAYEARGDMAAAESAYREALASAPDDMAANIGLARALRKAGRPNEAEPILRQVLEKAPGAIPAYKESVAVKLALRQYDAAMGDAYTAAALAEGDPEAQGLVETATVAKALAYIEDNKANLALQDLEALLQQHPDSAPVHVGMARALMATRKPVEARAELDKALALEPNLAEAHFQLGYLQHVLNGDAAAALAPYRKAVELDPANVEYRTNLGAVLSQLGGGQHKNVAYLDEAIAELDKVVKGAGAQRADAWIYLGGAYLAADRFQEAVTALEKALALAPDVQVANAYMAWAYFGLKDEAGFQKYGIKARQLGYSDAKFLDNLKHIEAGEEIK